MESCLKHLKKYNEAIVDLVEGNEKLHARVDKRLKEIVMKFDFLDSFLVS